LKPTPVSSLLHAATLVMSGIYLLLKCISVLNVSTLALTTAAILGTITALFAGTTALVQNDIKRVIAYSTCSQFGYLFASTGLSQSSSTVLHLSTHAGFKALLFICAGGVIHSMGDTQDMRRLGGTLTVLPFTYSAMLIASLSLMALPYLSGNTSKDLILELAATNITIPGTFMWLLGSTIAGITACYSVRLLALTFFNQPQASKNSYINIHEQPWGLIIPMITLSLVSIFYGYLAKEALAGIGTDSIINYYSSISCNVVEADFGLSMITKNFPVICTLLGTSCGIIIYILNPYVFNPMIINNTILNIYRSLSNKWLVDSFYSRFISWPYISTALFASKVVDRGLLELIGAYGLNIQLSTYPSLYTYKSSIIPLYTSQYLPGSDTAQSRYPIYGNNIPDSALYTGLFVILIILMVCLQIDTSLGIDGYSITIMLLIIIAYLILE